MADPAEHSPPSWLNGLTELLGARTTTAEEARREFGADRWHAAAMPAYHHHS